MRKTMIVIACMAVLAVVSGCSKPETPTSEKAPATASETYTCPMHPEVTSNKPGKCTKCGMTLVPKK